MCPVMLGVKCKKMDISEYIWVDDEQFATLVDDCDVTEDLLRKLDKIVKYLLVHRDTDSVTSNQQLTFRGGCIYYLPEDLCEILKEKKYKLPQVFVDEVLNFKDL